jgi:sulfur-oxidizing protein SoxA
MMRVGPDTAFATRPAIVRLSAWTLPVIVAVFAAAFVASVARGQDRQSVPLAVTGDAAVRPWVRDKNWPQRDEAIFNTLANGHVSPPTPQHVRKLANALNGDPARGATLVADRSRGGSCLACHVMGPAGNTDLPGNVGPDLSEIGSAGRDDEWLFNYVYDPRVYNPDSVMPPWGTNGLFDDTDIADIVAFLKTLKRPAVFRTDLDNPSKRPAPADKRDNLDPLENPAMWAIDRAGALWDARGPSASSCASCHDKAAPVFKTWAASMPYWEPRLNKVLGVEEFVARHAKATTGHDWLMRGEENMAMAVYLRYLANGSPIKIDVDSEPARQAYERGKALTALKAGQLNFSCNDCHVKSAGKWIRGQWLAPLGGEVDHFPTWRTSRNDTWDIRTRFQWCQVNIRGNELAPDAKEYGDLELYLTGISAGRAMNVPGLRD